MPHSMLHLKDAITTESRLQFPSHMAVRLSNQSGAPDLPRPAGPGPLKNLQADIIVLGAAVGVHGAGSATAVASRYD